MLPEEKQFKKLDAVWFHHGGILLKHPGRDGLNDELIKRGWRLVDEEMLHEIFEKNQRFLHRCDGYLLATDPRTIEMQGPDVIVPCIKSTDAEGLILTKALLRGGIIWDHSEIRILVVK